MRDKFKSRLVVMHGRLYILVPELVRDAWLKEMKWSMYAYEGNTPRGEPCEVEVTL